MANCPVGEMTCWGNVLVGEMSVVELSGWGNVLVGEMSGWGNVRLGKCPATEQTVPRSREKKVAFMGVGRGTNLVSHMGGPVQRRQHL